MCMCTFRNPRTINFLISEHRRTSANKLRNIMRSFIVCAANARYLSFSSFDDANARSTREFPLFGLKKKEKYVKICSFRSIQQHFLSSKSKKTDCT